MTLSRAFLIALLLCMPTTYAAADETGFRLNASIGAMFFDDSRRLDDEIYPSLGLGYRFDNPWEAELNYSQVGSKNKDSGLDADVSYITLGALYHLDSSGKIMPYLGIAAGETSVDSASVNRDYSVLSLAAGFGYALTQNSALRTELRSYSGSGNDDNLDVGISVGYQYRFGKTSAPVDGDDDNDGVANSIDLCPDTPAADHVGAAGCTIDGDDDGDGVANSRDKCLDTPPGVKVDAMGCTVDGDEDGDGVKDSRDQCPGTPSAMRVDSNGCPDDDDGDGVANQADKCPGTPAGVEVDANGCGADTDMDGVPDHRDECAKTFPPALVDHLGCYVILDEIVRITLDVEFDFDSSASRSEHSAEVEKVAEFMAKYPLTNVVLEGHTDSKGSDTYNQQLSDRRAATIARMLIETFKVDAGRVSSVGYGESHPVASNDNAEGRQKNRRVVAEISAMEHVKKRL